ncbi:MAG: DNA-methyltransferase [Planctomycetota bacterium]|jgi:site-specific DNA-methyltransferase (adenine-specific)
MLDLPAIPGVEPYYECEGIAVYCADCRELLPLIPADSIDLVLTDPPYGIRHESHGQLFRDASPISGDEGTELVEWLDEWALSCYPLAAFWSPYMPPRIKWRSVLVWDKGAHVGIGGDRETCWKRDAELIGVKGNRPLTGNRDSCVLRFHAVSPATSGHFCEKPVSLMQYLIAKMSHEGETVLDPFLGSGTTLVAAKQLNRQAIGIEIEERYCEIAAKRLEAAERGLTVRELETGQGTLFEE